MSKFLQEIYSSRPLWKTMELYHTKHLLVSSGSNGKNIWLPNQFYSSSSLPPLQQAKKEIFGSLGRLSYFWPSLDPCLGLTFFQFLPWHQVRDQSGWQWCGELQIITWPFAGKARTKCGGSAAWLDRVSLTHEECTTMEAWPQKGKLHNHGKVVNKNVSNES